MKKLKPLDWLAYNHIVLLRGYKWMQEHPDVCQRYLRMHWQLNFDLTSLKRRFVDYIKHIKGQ